MSLKFSHIVTSSIKQTRVGRFKLDTKISEITRRLTDMSDEFGESLFATVHASYNKKDLQRVKVISEEHFKLKIYQ